MCGTEGQGKCGGKRENEPGIILCILPSTGLKSWFFLQESHSRCLEQIEFSGRTELGLLHTCSCCALLSGGQGEADKGQKCRKWGGKCSGSISCALQGGLEQICCCAPFLQSVHWQEKRGSTGLWGCAFTLFSLLKYSLVLFLPLLVVQTRQQVG